jgi:protein gp37
LNFAAQLPHVWWGVTVENNKHGLPRIAVLKDTPARVRFLSVEPLLERLEPLDLCGIHWVIVGGKSGPGARSCMKVWVTDIRDSCARQHVAFFFKQWGGLRLRLTGRILDGRTYDESPALSKAEVPSKTRRRELAARTENGCKRRADGANALATAPGGVSPAH